MAGSTTTTTAYSLTFSGAVENHIGNQVIGQVAPRGVSVAQLRQLQYTLQTEHGLSCELVQLDAARAGLAPQEADSQAAAGAVAADNASGSLAEHTTPAAAAATGSAVGASDSTSSTTTTSSDSTASTAPLATPSAVKLPAAAVLVVRQGVALAGCEAAAIEQEMRSFAWDTRFFDRRRKKVLNKRARHNVCFADTAQEPAYESGKGRVVAFSSVPALGRLRSVVWQLLRRAGVEVPSLNCEGNRYDFTQKETGIGYHGDAERRLVVCLRVGAGHPLVYRWFLHSQPLGQPMPLPALQSGDMYIMSDYAVGYNWRRSSIPTLRHAAGSPAYTKYTPSRPQARGAVAGSAAAAPQAAAGGSRGGGSRGGGGGSASPSGGGLRQAMARSSNSVRRALAGLPAKRAKTQAALWRKK